MKQKRLRQVHVSAVVLATMAIASVAGMTLPRLARAGSRIEGALMAKAERQGRVRVLVQLDTADEASAAGSDASRTTSEAASATARAAAIRSAGARLEQSLAGADVRVARTFQTIPYVALDVTPEALAELEASPDALSITEDRLEKVSQTGNIQLVQADETAAAGFDGSGWTIAILDTGVDSTHPFLAGKVVNEACFSANGSCPDGSEEQVGTGAAAPCAYAPGACLHGTHVAGIAAGRGDGLSGVAPGANLIAIQVFSRFTGNDCKDDTEDPCAKTFNSDSLAALEYVFNLRSSYQIAAANMSLGGGRYISQDTCDSDDRARKAVVDNLRAAGIATVAAAGNDGFTNALSAPGCLSSVVSVGATTLSDQVASFSNSASFLDLLAPGVRILSSIPGGFAEISGTSQATPHVSGAFAVLDQRLGHASVDAVLSALESTGLPVTDSRNGITTSRIRIMDAANTLVPSGGSPSGLQVTPDGKHTLVSKDVGSERWAITLNADDGTVTGNVFSSSSEPQFVWCQHSFDDGNPDPYAVQITFSCSGAVPCPTGSCAVDEWTSIGSVTLPGSFFQPPLASAAVLGSAASVAAPEPNADASANASGEGAGFDAGTTSDSPVGAVAQARQSGLQVTPDQKRTLISKDVAGQRWAITRNLDDATVTGNVYATDGSPPTFVWCQSTGDNGSEIRFSCSGAGVCTGAPCSTSAWTFIASVRLPEEFFQP